MSRVPYPYVGKSAAEIVHDYAVVRGDLSEQYARDQLAHIIDALVADAEAVAWSEGHRAGRDYQGDGWNSDAHDPEDDNPYRAPTEEPPC